MTLPLFQRLLGDAFQSLAPQVRELHSLRTTSTWRGQSSIQRGPHPVAGVCAAIAGLPPSMENIATTVEFEAADDSEIWRRDFGGYAMQSRLHARENQLRERLGPMEFTFDLSARDGEIHWRTTGARLFGVLPLPAKWFANVRCRERGIAARYEFLVEATLPWVGSLIRYEGWLERA